MNQQRILAIAFLCSAFTACTHTDARPAKVSVSYVNGYLVGDAYSSDTSTLERSMCSSENLITSVKLEPNELKDLGDLALNTGFFNLPRSIDTNKHENGSISVCGGCATYKLEISYLGKSNSVSWSCNCDGQNSTPKELSQVIGSLNAMLYERENVKALARSKCRLY